MKPDTVMTIVSRKIAVAIGQNKGLTTSATMADWQSRNRLLRICEAFLDLAAAIVTGERHHCEESWHREVERNWEDVRPCQKAAFVREYQSLLTQFPFSGRANSSYDQEHNQREDQ